MRFLDLRDNLKDFTVFTINDVRMLEPNFHRRRLTEWQEKGYILKLAKGQYIFSDLLLSENVLFEIANRIYKPSYVSLEAALAYYNLIPESPYAVTSVTTRRTYDFTTPAGRFPYRTLKPALFYGYEICLYNGKTFTIASPEKAVLDYLYLNPTLRSDDDFASLRIDRDTFLSKISRRRFDMLLRRAAIEALSVRAQALYHFLLDSTKD